MGIHIHNGLEEKMQEHIFERLAHERGITVKQMRAIISALKRGGMIRTLKKGNSGEKSPARENSRPRMNGCGMR